MPQFDFTTYSSQIFWFAICFSLLYCFSHFIILPRILNILKDRRHVIDSDLSSAQALEDKLQALQTKTDLIKKEASQKYQSKLEEVSKTALKQREKMIEELKEKMEKMTKNSRQELKSFVENSHAKSQTAAQNLAAIIKEKLFRI